MAGVGDGGCIPMSKWLMWAYQAWPLCLIWGNSAGPLKLHSSWQNYQSSQLKLLCTQFFVLPTHPPHFYRYFTEFSLVNPRMPLFISQSVSTEPNLRQMEITFRPFINHRNLGNAFRIKLRATYLEQWKEKPPHLFFNKLVYI